MFSPLIESVLVIVLALLIDRVFGEPRHFHPLVGFGYIASFFERYGNHSRLRPVAAQCAGMLSWFFCAVLLTVLLVIVFAYIKQVLNTFSPLLDVVVVYGCVGYTSLRQHTQAVLFPLQKNKIALARENVGLIVSRDTQSMDETQIRQATIESVLENGSDAVIAPLFWYLLAGLPGIILYRLANTLDAMWGYKTIRFLYFGRFAARMDDILNWFPARITALLYTVLGDRSRAWRCWQTQSAQCESPNAGVVMAAGAGALGILLGGDSIYHGQPKSKPILGDGRSPENADIVKVIHLLDRSLYLLVGLLIILAAVSYDRI